MKIMYAVVEEYEQLEVRYGPVGDYTFLDWAAGECGEHFYDHHDGWDWDWPLTFVLFDVDDDHELGRFTVEMEMEPTFSGSALKAETEKGGE